MGKNFYRFVERKSICTLIAIRVSGRGDKGGVLLFCHRRRRASTGLAHRDGWSSEGFLPLFPQFCFIEGRNAAEKMYLYRRKTA